MKHPPSIHRRHKGRVKAAEVISASPSNSSSSTTTGVTATGGTSTSSNHHLISIVRNNNNNNNNDNNKFDEGSTKVLNKESPLVISPAHLKSDVGVSGMQPSFSMLSTQPAFDKTPTTSPTSITSSSSSSSSSSSWWNSSSRWNDILVFGFVITGFASLSVFVGVAAGISISIYYFERLETDHRRLLMGYYGVAAGGYLRQQQPPILSSTITNPDPTIELANTGNAVVATTPNGRTTVLMVVQEVSPLNYTTTTTTTSSRTKTTTTTTAAGSASASWPYRTGSELAVDTWMSTGSSSLWPYPRLQWEDWVTVSPLPCSTNPNTLGYSSYWELKTVLRDVNRYSSERYDRWNEYFELRQSGGSNNNNNNAHDSAATVTATMTTTTRSPLASLYYQEEITITICPRTTLYGMFGTLFVNTESLTIQCEDCTIANWGSHFSFGPSAKNVRLSGLTFRHATASSVIFPYDGADVSFEHCQWINNAAHKPNQGSVLDMHSSSAVHFYRSFVSQPRPGWRRGYQTAALSIRQS